MNARDYTEAEILDCLKEGGKVVCSIRLQSGNDWVVTVENTDDYEIVKDDIIPDMEMTLLVQ